MSLDSCLLKKVAENSTHKQNISDKIDFKNICQFTTLTIFLTCIIQVLQSVIRNGNSLTMNHLRIIIKKINGKYIINIFSK